MVSITSGRPGGRRGGGDMVSITSGRGGGVSYVHVFSIVVC